MELCMSTQELWFTNHYTTSMGGITCMDVRHRGKVIVRNLEDEIDSMEIYVTEGICRSTIRFNGLVLSDSLFCFKMVKGLKINKSIKFIVDNLQYWSNLDVMC